VTDQEKAMSARTPTLHPDDASTARRATVADAMHHGVVSCAPGATLAEVAGMMTEHGIHGVVVNGVRRDATGSERLVWGLVSDLDLAEAVGVARTPEPTAGDLAATPAVVVAPDDLLADAARLMHDYDVHHLIVVAASDRRPVGVVSTLDVAAAVAAGRA
jgi:CBS domain-containing protein